MEKKKLPNVVIKNARLKFRNFAGREKTFNREGDRNFNVVIDDVEVAQQMIADGWNVRVTKPKEEGDEPEYLIQVAVGYKVLPPVIFLLTQGKKKKTALDEEDIAKLDTLEIVNANVSIRPRQWEMNGKSGIKAYLKTLYVTIEEDEFADEFEEFDTDDDMPV